MKKLSSLTIIAVVLTAASTLAQTSAQPTTAKTLTGVVSDSMCGDKHMAKDKSATECTRECVKQGAKYALVVGKTVYTLEGHEVELDKVAGMKAIVKGKVSGETVAVQSVESAMKMK